MLQPSLQSVLSLVPRPSLRSGHETSLSMTVVSRLAELLVIALGLALCSIAHGRSFTIDFEHDAFLKDGEPFRYNLFRNHLLIACY